MANARRSDAQAMLESSADRARRIGLLPAELEARLASAPAGPPGAAATLGADARKAGFLLIARKAEGQSHPVPGGR
jgi:hypothetical protein